MNHCRLDKATPHDNVSVRMSDGVLYAGPLWSDASGMFVYYQNQPVPVVWDVRAGEYRVNP